MVSVLRVSFCRIWAVCLLCITSVFCVGDVYVLNILGVFGVTVLYMR